MDTIVGRVLENCTKFQLDIKGDYEGSQPYFQKIKYLVVTCDNGFLKPWKCQITPWKLSIPWWVFHETWLFDAPN